MPDSLYAARLSFQDGTAVTGLIVAVVCIAVFTYLTVFTVNKRDIK